jgi:hypothetical protein
LVRPAAPPLRSPALGIGVALTLVCPRADALLLAAWLRSRLRREVALTRRNADLVTTVLVDGEPIEPTPRSGTPTGSDLLSAELDTLSRDTLFEAAVHAAAR